jgi:putative transposase
MRQVRAARRFRIDAMVALPGRLHCIWTLLAGDADYSRRWQAIKVPLRGKLVCGDTLSERRQRNGGNRGRTGGKRGRTWII